MPHYPKQIDYSEKYNDNIYEYRHVLLPKEIFKKIPAKRLLIECEWRSIGIVQSKGWNHYSIHKPEPHILLFRRPIGTDPETGMISRELQEKVADYEKMKKKNFEKI
jgi:cyclin-dependent kinase regulatory subunit CKS1